jgi:organic radical activating enzyme
MSGSIKPFARDYLESDVADHCNLRCKHCTHHSPYMDRGFYPLSEFQADIHRLANYMTVDTFRLLGGEPLLNPSLLEYIRVLRNSELSRNVSIATNGLLLDKCPQSIFDYIDAIDITIYPLGRYLVDKIMKSIERIRKKHSCAVNVYYKDEFIAQELTKEILDQDVVDDIFKTCWIRKHCHALYRGFYFVCMQAPRKSAFLRAVKCSDDYSAVTNWHNDGLDIYADTFSSSLGEYLMNDTIPLNACRWCLGTRGAKQTHVQLPANHKSKPPGLVSLKNLLGK